MSTTRRDRRRRDRELRRSAANRRIGHDHAYAIVFGPIAAPIFATLAGVVAAGWVWYHVDHQRIAAVVGAAGILCVLAYAAWLLKTGTLHTRMMAAARGVRPSPWWHAVAVAGALFIAAAYVIYQP